MEQDKTGATGKCPIMHGGNTRMGGGGTKNMDWWPNQLNLKILHLNDKKSNPLDEGFNYAEAFKKLDLNEVKKSIELKRGYKYC